MVQSMANCSQYNYESKEKATYFENHSYFDFFFSPIIFLTENWSFRRIVLETPLSKMYPSLNIFKLFQCDFVAQFRISFEKQCTSSLYEILIYIFKCTFPLNIRWNLKTFFHWATQFQLETPSANPSSAR